jgi:hypothetical protein
MSDSITSLTTCPILGHLDTFELVLKLAGRRVLTHDTLTRKPCGFLIPLTITIRSPVQARFRSLLPKPEPEPGLHFSEIVNPEPKPWALNLVRTWFRPNFFSIFDYFAILSLFVSLFGNLV